MRWFSDKLLKEIYPFHPKIKYILLRIFLFQYELDLVCIIYYYIIYLKLCFTNVFILNISQIKLQKNPNNRFF